MSARLLFVLVSASLLGVDVWSKADEHEQWRFAFTPPYPDVVWAEVPALHLQGASYVAVGIVLLTMLLGAVGWVHRHGGLSRVLAGALGLLWGGGAANLVDVLRHGGVLDWWAFGPLLWNVADAAIYSGLGLVVLVAVRTARRPRHECCAER